MASIKHRIAAIEQRQASQRRRKCPVCGSDDGRTRPVVVIALKPGDTYPGAKIDAHGRPIPPSRCPECGATGKRILLHRSERSTEPC